MRGHVHLLQSSIAVTHNFGLLHRLPSPAIGRVGCSWLVKTTRMAHQHLSELFVAVVVMQFAQPGWRRSV